MQTDGDAGAEQRAEHDVGLRDVLMIALDWLSRIFVEVFRGLPVVITIVFVWLGLPSLGVELSG